MFELCTGMFSDFTPNVPTGSTLAQQHGGSRFPKLTVSPLCLSYCESFLERKAWLLLTILQEGKQPEQHM